MRSRIMAVETANPLLAVSQRQAMECVRAKGTLSPRALQWYERFLADPSIENRYFGLENLNDVHKETPDESSARFQRVAAQIGSAALERVLHASGLHANQIDALIVTTCTGYLCPGLTSYLSQQLSLRENIFTLDLAGIGCGAALPALRAADQYLQSHLNSTVAVVCVEVSSAAIHWAESIDVILSNALFADGAAACLLTNKPESEGLEVAAFESILWPQYRDHLRFKHRDSRLCNVISREVPGIASKAVQRLYLKLSEKTSRKCDHFGMHPGGRKILDSIEEAVPQFAGKLNHSREVLRRYGNMSSPSILFVLKEILQKENLQSGEPVMIFSFGAGFTAFGALLEYVSLKNEKTVQNGRRSYASL